MKFPWEPGEFTTWFHVSILSKYFPWMYGEQALSKGPMMFYWSYWRVTDRLIVSILFVESPMRLHWHLPLKGESAFPILQAFMDWANDEEKPLDLESSMLWLEVSEFLRERFGLEPCKAHID